jgi:hypothetical protein
LYRYAAGLAVLLLSFWSTLLLLDGSSDKQPVDPNACPAGETAILNRPYSSLEGHAYKANVPAFAHQADTATSLFSSPARLCEDKLVLGPPHTYHAEIVSVGLGRYSHFGDDIIFSSSDNSDPNSNGRQYVVVIPSRRK